MSGVHTPGPWSVHREEDDGWLLVVAGGPVGRIVANVNAESCPDKASAPAFVVMPAEANARAIAAVPELLDVAQSVRRYDALLRQYNGPLSTLCAGDVAAIDAAYDALVRAAEAAIAKATGGAS